MRKVKPAQSKPCTVFNYTLAFSHRCNFCMFNITLHKRNCIPNLEHKQPRSHRRGMPYWEPSFATIAPYDEVAANCVSASVGPPAEGSVDGEHAHVHVIANGHANGYHQDAVVANGHVDAEKDDDARSNSSEEAPGKHWASAADAWQALRRLLLCSRAPPAVPALYTTPAGVPALHGVAHQISEEQMDRIKLTEGGGGNKDMGTVSLCTHRHPFKRYSLWRLTVTNLLTTPHSAADMARVRPSQPMTCSQSLLHSRSSAQTCTLRLPASKCINS